MADGDLPGSGTGTAGNPADSTASGNGTAATNLNHAETTPPDWILDEVKLLLDNMAAPETVTNTGLAARADPGAIEDSISPPEPTWTWDDNQARIGQIVYDFDVGKYGVQSDIHKLFKLTSIDPPVWQLVRDFSVATWVWRNQDERDGEVALDADVGKVGYQADIDTYFQLTKATPAAWKEVSSPQATTAPLSLSTGASDADSFHDFYRLQVAFEDVWAELIDKKAEVTAQEFYAKWDALVNEGEASDVNDEQYSSELSAIKSLIEEAQGENNSSYLSSAVGVIDNIHQRASVPFWQSFGLDLENTRTELEYAVSGTNLSVSPIQDALNAALQNIANLTAELSSGAAARKAAFSLIPQGEIGGYAGLERFLNEVRVVLGLPTAQAASASSPTATNNSDAYFETVLIDIRSARDYLDSLVQAMKSFGVNENQAPNFFIPVTSHLNSAVSDLVTLRNSLSDDFKGTYADDLNGISASLTNATSDVQTFVSELYHGPLTHDYIDAALPNPNIPNSVTVTKPKISASLDSAESALTTLRSKYNNAPPSSSQGDNADGAATNLTFPELETLFYKLSDMLKERYRFDIFAPGSINYGLLLNYRQQWKPQSYQVGSLVKTIPLAPRETQKYTTKTVVKKSRNAKELDESLRSKKEDKSATERVDAEIFADANDKTDFKANASGSFNVDVYNINADTHFDKNQAAESRSTKKDQREAVLKSAQEYRNEHKLEVTTDTSREDETTSYREISNPNDELTVTYLFYELQRRYLVSEALHRATPVILVANDVPAPHEIDQGWLVRHDWILKRAILDDSFLPALEYLATNYTGEETALIVLEMNVQHQRAVVDKLSQQVELANQALNAATVGVTNAEDWSLSDQRRDEYFKFVKSFFDPMGIGQGASLGNDDSNRARLQFANAALDRAQLKVNDLTGQMRTELTALQAATERYTAAARRHYGMLAEIDRLRLHVKDNILHYMQAIWSHEPADQRYFRLYNLDVPVFEHNTALTATPAMERMADNPDPKTVFLAADPVIVATYVAFEPPTLSATTKKLHQVADIDDLIGYKGNYMIFPLTDFDNYMTWYLVHNYIQFDADGEPYVSDPAPNLKLEDVQNAMESIQAQQPETFAALADKFVDVMTQLLSNEAEQMVIVPSDQLYIEALPGTHPLLEDFKLKHRALDVMKVQAEVRKAELENLRLAARLARGELGDPDVEKKIVIEGNTDKIAIQADSA